MEPGELQELAGGLAARSVMRDPRLRQATEDLLGRIEGQVTIGQSTYTLRVDLDRLFPSSLPHVYLLEYQSIAPLPHLMPNGSICYRRRDNIILDRRDPLAIIEEAVLLSCQIIQRGIEAENLHEFVDEWVACWSALPDGVRVVGHLEPGPPPRRFYSAGVAQLPMGQLLEDRAQYKALKKQMPQSTAMNGILVPLRPGTLLMPPEASNPLTIGWMRKVFQEHCDEAHRRRINRLVNKFQREEIILFSLPRFSGGEVLFGQFCHGVSVAHPLRRDGCCVRVLPLNVIRMDRAYLLPRGGADRALQERRVAVVGCGSVGSRISEELARAGIGELLLVDPDILCPENIFRHTLGRTHVGFNKAKSMRADLLGKFPFLRCETIEGDILHHHGTIDWSTIDAAVIATGNPSVELYLNEHFHSHMAPPLVVYTWVEALGLGGHALLTRPGLSSPRGCLECLYTDIQKGGLRGNRSAFLDPAAQVDQDLMGCGNRFTPYGGIHASRTALLATQLTLDALRGQLEGNPLESWKGTAEAARIEGAAQTPYYDMSDQERLAGALDYRNPHCKVCGGKG